MTFLLLFHSGLMIAGSFAIWFFSGPHSALSFAAGAGLILFNLIGLVLFWPRILAKKQVALSISGIVFKFAILVGILYVLVDGKRVSLVWLAAGISLVVPSVVAASIKVSRDNPVQASDRG
jgi:hypothetical protein